MTHAHITTWVLALILFFVSFVLFKSGNVKGHKIVQMILRLMYILIVVTGGLLLFSISNISMLYIVKALGGILVIGLLEMIIVRSTKGKSTSIFGILFTILIVCVIYLGFKLPLGIPLF